MYYSNSLSYYVLNSKTKIKEISTLKSIPQTSGVETKAVNNNGMLKYFKKNVATASNEATYVKTEDTKKELESTDSKYFVKCFTFSTTGGVTTNVLVKEVLDACLSLFTWPCAPVLAAYLAANSQVSFITISF